MVSVLFYGVYVDVCGGHTATFTVIPQELPILFLETGSLAGVESVKKSRLAGQGTPGSTCSTTWAQDYKPAPPPALPFVCGFWRLNSGPHAFKARALPTCYKLLKRRNDKEKKKARP